jgi:hypothetical protein
MPRYLIADFITEFNPKYDNLKSLAKPFEYSGSRPTDIKLNITDEHLADLLSRMTEGSTLAGAEEFAYACDFNKKIIKHNAMLIHSSAIIYKGNTYLFAAPSGIGKSTHTRLWKQAFGDDVTFINDDKPVVKINDGKCMVYGTPFDGGSGIANNISAPLKAIIYVERDKDNSIEKLSSSVQILRRLYFSTVHSVDEQTAYYMLNNFERLINSTDFYLLKCNMDISAAYLARDGLIKE